jgi:tetratricopeptide (TPR) repeat protein
MMSRRDWLFALALFIVIFLVYAPAWNGQAIWDDDIHITRPDLRSLHGLARIWTEPSAAPQYYPLLHTLFWAEQKLWGDAVLPYHLITIYCHALLALLIVPIMRRLDLPGAWLAAAVFALHPVHVESVAWFSEIKNTLSGVLAAAAVLSYLRYDQDRHRGAYAAALIFFIFGLLTKTAVVALPIVLLVIFWWKRGSIKAQRDLVPLIPFFGLALAAGALTVWVEEKFCATKGEVFDFSLLDRCLAAGRLFWFYLGKIFCPLNLSLIYPRWTIDSGQWWQYLFPVGAIVLLIALWFQRAKTRALLAACLCFLAILFPVLGFFNLSFYMNSPPPLQRAAIFRADHFQYLADIPIIVLVCAAGAALCLNRKGAARAMLAAVAIGVVATLGLASFTQARTYRDAETCFRAVLEKNPDSATAHNNVAGVLRRKGALNEAINHYRRALALEPNHEFANYNLAEALVQQGELDEAILRLNSVLRDNPNNPYAYYTLANALAKQKNRSDTGARYGWRRVFRTRIPISRTCCSKPAIPRVRSNIIAKRSVSSRTVRRRITIWRSVWFAAAKTSRLLLSCAPHCS